MPRVDSAPTDAYAGPGRYTSAADLDRVAAPHRPAVDPAGIDLAPFPWPGPAAVQVHAWHERDGADRHTMTWSADPIRDAPPRPDHDPHAVALPPLPPPPSTQIATRAHPWPRARMDDA
ncbi:hypothetical protein GGF32_004881, partial [Allomyces javanicus]